MALDADGSATRRLFDRIAALERALGGFADDVAAPSDEQRKIERDLQAARQVGSVYRQALAAIASLPADGVAASRAAEIARTILDETGQGAGT